MDQSESSSTSVDRQLLALDLDHTLLQGNASFVLGKNLYRSGLLSLYKIFSCLFVWLLHRCGLFSTIFLHKTIFHLIFKGKERSVVERVVAEMFDSMDTSDLLMRPEVLTEIRKYKENETSSHIVEIALLSTSPDFLVAYFAKAISASWWVGTEYRVDSAGIFSSISTIVTGRKKAELLRLWKKNHEGDGSVEIIAYSDSARDLPMLSEASKSICVHPTLLLRVIAWIKKWQVLK